MKESELTRRTRKAIEEKGHVAFKIHGGPNQRQGIPDILCSVFGLLVAIEMKTPENKKGTTKLQQRTLEKLAESGAVVGVARSVNSALKLIALAEREAKAQGLT